MVKHYHGDDSDLKLLMVAVPKAFEAVTVEDYDRRVKEFFDEADNPGLKRPYRTCGYLPMVELLRYLEANDFATYIASGGDRDFMRPVAEDLYGIPPERVIGSALGITYSSEGGQSALLYKGAMDFFDDGPEKPVRIWSRIGRRPILAFGNSNGDVPMLAFAGDDSMPRCGCCCCTTTLNGNSTTSLGRSRRWRWQPSRIGPWSASRTTGTPCSPMPHE